MPSSTEFDEKMMQRALGLARRALGQTSPNPMVGAVVAKNRRLIGEGYHHRAGTPHAEVHALKAAGDRAKGADLYVTLEPCSTFGRTPPCTEAIIAAGIKRVIVATEDPNPRHRGRGFELLREQGIKVEIGLLREESNQLNESFNKWILKRTPFVTAKAAMSLDGKIATASGESKWISGEPSRAFVQELRRASDAVMVGSNTVLKDDPRLTVRTGNVERQPCRIIVDSHGRTPLAAGVYTDEYRAGTLVLCSEIAPVSWRKQLTDSGVTILIAPVRRDHLDLAAALQLLGERNLTSVLVEGGGGLLGALFDARLVDKLFFFYAPKIIGGVNAPTAVEGQGITVMKEALQLRRLEWRRLGEDLLVSGYL